MFKNFFNPAYENLADYSRQKGNKEKNQADTEQEPGGMTRRGFFKSMALLAGGVIANEALKKTEIIAKTVEHIAKPRDYEIVEVRHKLVETEVTEKIMEFDSSRPIVIDEQTIKDTEKDWYENYTTTGLRDDLINAEVGMREWTEAIKIYFENKGVPLKYLYLAIPESHWDLTARSDKEAVGPYQFTKQTGKKYGLVGENFDYRAKPLESAKACAELLSDLYKVCKDWDLALAGYNGGFIWGYLRGNGNPSFKGFLAYLSEKANNLKTIYKETKMLDYEVESGDSLPGLAKYYHVGVKELKKMNGLRNNKLKEGQKLKIPLADSMRKILFMKEVRGFRENLNYPAKFNAVIRVLKEGLKIDI